MHSDLYLPPSTKPSQYYTYRWKKTLYLFEDIFSGGLKSLERRRQGKKSSESLTDKKNKEKPQEEQSELKDQPRRKESYVDKKCRLFFPFRGTTMPS